MAYAENTNVSTDRSKSEIEKTLQRYGADQFMYGWNVMGGLEAFAMMNTRGQYLFGSSR